MNRDMRLRMSWSRSGRVVPSICLVLLGAMLFSSCGQIREVVGIAGDATRTVNEYDRHNQEEKDRRAQRMDGNGIPSNAADELAGAVVARFASSLRSIDVVQSSQYQMVLGFGSFDFSEGLQSGRDGARLKNALKFKLRENRSITDSIFIPEEIADVDVTTVDLNNERLGRAYQDKDVLVMKLLVSRDHDYEKEQTVYIAAYTVVHKATGEVKDQGEAQSVSSWD